MSTNPSSFESLQPPALRLGGQFNVGVLQSYRGREHSAHAKLTVGSTRKMHFILFKDRRRRKNLARFQSPIWMVFEKLLRAVTTSHSRICSSVKPRFRILQRPRGKTQIRVSPILTAKIQQRSIGFR